MIPTPPIDLDIKGGVVDAMEPVAYALYDAIHVLTDVLTWCLIGFFILLAVCLLWRTSAKVKYINRKN